MASPFSFAFSDEVHNLELKQPQHISASDGIKLAYYNFVPHTPKTILIFYHGGGLWSKQLYQYMAQQLCNEHNIGVYLFDIRGHGHSQGARGDASSTQQVWQDVSTAIDFVHSNHPDCQLTLGGHSSGAGLILNYSGFHKHPAISNYLFLAPFLGARAGTSYEHADPSKRFVKDIRFLPLLINIFTGGFFFAHTHVIFMNYPAEEKQKDALILDSYTCAMANAIGPNNPQKLFESLDNPFIMLIGEKDEQFIPEKVLAFKDYATQVKDQSVAQVLPDATDLSILFTALSIIADPPPLKKILYLKKMRHDSDKKELQNSIVLANIAFSAIITIVKKTSSNSKSAIVIQIEIAKGILCQKRILIQK